jgi:hypothetical protein
MADIPQYWRRAVTEVKIVGHKDSAVLPRAGMSVADVPKYRRVQGQPPNSSKIGLLLLWQPQRLPYRRGRNFRAQLNGNIQRPLAGIPQMLKGLRPIAVPRCHFSACNCSDRRVLFRRRGMRSQLSSKQRELLSKVCQAYAASRLVPYLCKADVMRMR